MLSTPNAGWTKLKIDCLTADLSDVDDVPYKLLEAVEFVHRTQKPYAVLLDTGDVNYIVIFDYFETHMIIDSESWSVCQFHIERIAAELIADIRRDISEWSRWCSSSEDETSEREKDLLALCNIIEKRLPPKNDKVLRFLNDKQKASNRRHSDAIVKIKKIRNHISHPSQSGPYVDWEMDSNGIMKPVGKYLKYPGKSKWVKSCKMQSNRRIRRSRAEFKNGGAYRKHYDLWWNIY